MSTGTQLLLWEQCHSIIIVSDKVKKKKEHSHTRRERSGGLHSEKHCCKVTMFLAMLVQGPQMLRVTGKLLLWTQCLTTTFLQVSALFNVFFFPLTFSLLGFLERPRIH